MQSPIPMLSSVANESPIRGVPLERHMQWLHQLAATGGPDDTSTVAFTAWIAELSDMVAAGRVERSEWSDAWKLFNLRLLPQAMSTKAFLKSHGYAGDFEIIDAIYTQHKAADLKQQRWDDYFHAQAAPRAVRNRKGYFQRMATNAAVAATRLGDCAPRILNVASGLGRDMMEWLTDNPNTPVRFECVELDANAIAYASELCAKHLERIQFHRANALRFHPKDNYHLVWSSGLFDYLGDSLFVRLLRRLLSHTLPCGEVVIGNFGSYNPSRAYMELLGDWNLIHRGPEHLRELALEAGAAEHDITIGREPACVNLFLHVRKPRTSA